jgi:predicted transcriptional regulator
MEHDMRTIVDLPDEQIAALKALAERNGVSRAELVRRAVEAYLEQRRVPTGDPAFGLWRKRGEDGLNYQERLRREWDR